MTTSAQVDAPPVPLEQLPPWDQLPYYALPVEANVAVNGFNVLAAKGDPWRRVLIFSLNLSAGGSVVASTLSNGNDTIGLTLTVGQPLIVNWDWFGPIVTVPWYLSTPLAGNANVTVLQQSLIAWPGQGPPKVVGALSNGIPATNGTRFKNGNSPRNWLSTDSGTEPTQAEIDDLAAALQSCAGGTEWAGDGNNWLPPGRWGRTAYP